MAQARLFSKFFAAAAALFIVSLAGLVSAPAEAQAQSSGWTLCNRTSYVIEASVAHYEGQGVVVDGWKRLRPGACELALEGPLRPGIHYLFARSSTAHRGGRKIWGGDFPLCVDTTGSFSVESPQDCAAMGLEPRDFRPVLVENKNNWRTSFTETEDFTAAQSAAAGVQRLLADAV